MTSGIAETKSLRSQPTVIVVRARPLPELDMWPELRSAGGCSTGYGGARIARFDLRGAGELLRLDCAAPPVDARSFWFLLHPGTAVPEPLRLPLADRSMLDAGHDGLLNAGFDFDFGVLRAFTFLSEDQDCGTMRVWANTRHGFELIEQRDMPVCDGRRPGDWTVTWRRQTRIDDSEDRVRPVTAGAAKAVRPIAGTGEKR